LVTRILVQFIGQIGAVLWLRRSAPDLKRPFRMWLFPLPALVALAGWIFLFSTSGVKTMLYAAGVIALGAVCFLVRERWMTRPRVMPLAKD
jgi:amino acid transporter